MTAPIYAVGDIHGQLNMLLETIALIDAHGGPDATIVFLGDLVDRGAQSKEVIETLMDGIASGRNWTVLKGNHDRLFEWFMEDTPRMEPRLLVGYDWFHDQLGGKTTLASYGITVTPEHRYFRLHAEARTVIPQSHIDFLRAMPIYHTAPGLLFVHAGIDPHKTLCEQSEDDMLWIRDPFHNHTGAYPYLIVHGHTPVKTATHYGNRVNLDSGAGYGRPITAAVFDAGRVFTLGPNGRVELLPTP